MATSVVVDWQWMSKIIKIRAQSHTVTELIANKEAAGEKAGPWGKVWSIYAHNGTEAGENVAFCHIVRD